MVSLKDVRASNASFKAKAIPGLVALFIGGTSGVGKGTLIQFAKNANAPTVYVVGRSKTSATPLLNELETLNPNGTFTFIETQISLIKNVDRVCEEIKAKEKKLDIIFLSTGYLTLEGRQGMSNFSRG
jgi:NADP-dependent 3-hydroxy acid dehydrogenase YdfG